MGARLRVTYRDEARTDDVVKLGAFSQVAAKRRFGIAALQSGDPEAILFGAFVELHGPAKAEANGAFDEWLKTVEEMETVDEDPPKAEPTSSASSPESPPTLE